MKCKTTRISISEPCSQDWEEMTPAGQGKHCAKCEKTVVDFTRMQDYKIIDYLRNNSKTCGRFYNHQLERDITVFPKMSVWQSRIRKFAVSVLLISQLLPKKTFAGKLPEETIPRMAFDKGFATDSSINDKSFSGNIFQPDSIVNYALKMFFTIHAFKVEINSDTLMSNEFSFHLPDSLKNEIVQVELLTKDTIYLFEINLEEDSLLSQNSNTSVHHFYFDKIWKYRKVMISSIPDFTLNPDIRFGSDMHFMGPPSIQSDFRVEPIKFETIIGDSVSVVSGRFVNYPEEDTSWKKKFSEDKSAFKAGLNSHNKWNWWWLVFVFSLSFLIRWFFNGLYSNKRQFENGD